MVLIRGALEIERVVVMVDNFKHSHVLRCPLDIIKLLLEASLAVEVVQHEVIS